LSIIRKECTDRKRNKSCSKTKYASIILLFAFSEKLEKFNLINYYELSKLDNAITQSRFLNRTELKTKGETNSDGSIAKPWSATLDHNSKSQQDP